MQLSLRAAPKCDSARTEAMPAGTLCRVRELGAALLVVFGGGAVRAQAQDGGALDGGVPAPDGGAAPATPDAGLAPADAAPRPLSPATSVALPSGTRVDVECTVRAHRELEGSVYVVCGDGRLLWVDGEEGWVEEVAVRGRALDLFEHGGRVWVELVRHEAIALDPAMPGAIVSESEAHSRFSRNDPARSPTQPSARVVAAARPWGVAEPDDERPPGPGTRRSPEPRRLPGWQIGATMRPILSTDTGAGVVGELSLIHRFEAPAMVELEIDPIGVADEDETIGVFGASAYVGYDDARFMLALGLGGWYVEIVEFDRFARGLGLAIHQSIRIGQLEGTAAEATSTFVLVDGELFFGGIKGAIQLRVSPSMHLLFRGGGGIAGHAWGELAGRVQVGRGREEGRGVFVIPSIGAAVVSNGNNEVGGPSIGFGIEWRGN